MSRALNIIETAQLEGLVDRVGLPTVLAALATIAYEKSAHVDEAWTDKGLAQRWRRAADKLAGLAMLTELKVWT